MRGFVEIMDTLDTTYNPATGGMKTDILWSAGRICGCGRFGYVIYGEPTRASLERKLFQAGYKFEATLTLNEEGEDMKKDIQYAVMNFDDPGREEIPFNAATDSEARLQACAVAKKYDIKNYSIIFYRSSDGCRGKIDS